MPSGIVDENIAKGFGVWESLVAIYLVGGVEEEVREIVGSGSRLRICVGSCVTSSLIAIGFADRDADKLYASVKEGEREVLQREMNIGKKLINMAGRASR